MDVLTYQLVLQLVVVRRANDGQKKKLMLMF